MKSKPVPGSRSVRTIEKASGIRERNGEGGRPLLFPYQTPIVARPLFQSPAQGIGSISSRFVSPRSLPLGRRTNNRTPKTAGNRAYTKNRLEKKRKRESERKKRGKTNVGNGVPRLSIPSFFLSLAFIFFRSSPTAESLEQASILVVS